MVNVWFKFLLRQLAIALVIVTSILLLSEILLPASILPYFNLHILVLVTLTIAITSPTVEEKSRWRIIGILPILALLLIYAWLIFGISASGLMLLAALVILLIGLTVALIRPESTSQSPIAEIHLTQETIVIDGDTIQITEQETDVFMR